MPRRTRGHTEEIHIHIRGHAPQSKPMLASEVEELVQRLLNQSFQQARLVGEGMPGQTRVRLALKLEPIEYVTDFSSHPMGEKLKELAQTRTRNASLVNGRKHPGWILEYIATQIGNEEFFTSEESLAKRLLTQQD